MSAQTAKKDSTKQSFWDVDEELLDLIRYKLKYEPSFKNAFTRNLTEQIINSLKRRAYGQKTNHAVIYIRGCGGIDSRGVGKCLYFSRATDYLIQSDGTWTDFKNLNKKIICVDENLETNKTNITKKFNRRANLIYNIITRTGRTISLTVEHPLLTINGWSQAKNLKIGDEIAVMRKIKTKPSKKPKKYEIKLLAYLIADGNITRGVRFSKKLDPKIINEFKTCVKAFDGKLRIIKRKHNTFDIYGSVRDSKGHFINPVLSYLKKLNLLGCDSGNKFIPNTVMGSSNENVALFLNRYFSCDGGVEKGTVHITSKSELLMRQTQHLLLRFGIISYLRIKVGMATNSTKHQSTRYWHLSILDSENLKKFKNQIGFFVKRKHDAIIVRTKPNTNLDTIPKKIFQFINLVSYMNLVKMGFRNGMCYFKQYSLPRSKIKRLIKNPTLFLFKQYLSKITSENIYWDKIVDVRKKFYKSGINVSDVQITNPSHMYIANDIIVHNSSVGLELAQILDPEFKIEKLAFHNNELLEIIERQGEITEIGKEKSQCFVRDETPDSLKKRASVEFSIIAETLRDSRINLVLIKPDMEDNNLATIILEPFMMSRDISKIRCAVFNHGSGKYRGYVDVNIHKDSKIWQEYMVLKKQFQLDVVKRRVGVFDSTKYSQVFLEKYPPEKYIEETRRGTPKLVQTRLRKYISLEYANLTNEERQYILDDVKEKLKDAGKLD